MSRYVTDKSLKAITSIIRKRLEEKSDAEHTHSYNELADKPTIPTVDVTKSYVDAQLETKADSSTVTSHTENTTIHITSSERTAWNNKSDFSGSYNDLADKPTIPTVATTSVAGTVKPDGSTITITSDGTISAVGGSSGTSDYNSLSNKPQINGVSLSGNKTSADLSLANSSHTHEIADVNGLQNRVPWESVSVLTQAEYDAITTPVSTTLYLIKEA